MGAKGVPMGAIWGPNGVCTATLKIRVAVQGHLGPIWVPNGCPMGAIWDQFACMYSYLYIIIRRTRRRAVGVRVLINLIEYN